jgi:hypothetical protein
MENEFIKKHSANVQGMLSCYDRVIIKGTLPTACHAGAMTNLLYRKGYLLKDITQFTNPLRNELHANAKQIAKTEGIEIEFIRNSGKVRKEDLVKKHLKQRQVQSGLLCILSVMESCTNYVYACDKQTGRSFLRMTGGKCLHYYFYFIDPDYGLCYLRVPAWCPFQLQFYFNAHNWLARQLDKAQIKYEIKDNAFTFIEDFTRAQTLADSLDARQLHRRLDALAARYCPAYEKVCKTGYHWSIMQIEHATDIVFKDKKTLAPIYDGLLKNVMHTVTPNDVARFLGRKGVHGKNDQPLDTSYKHVMREEMRRIKHRMGSTSVKVYDKFGQVLRVETTANDTSNFYHYRSVEHRDGTKSSKLAPVKKSVYSLKALVPIMQGCNKRYLKYIAAFDAPVAGKKRLDKVSRPIKVNARSYRGFNFFDKDDDQLLRLVSKGDFVIHGFRNKDLRREMTNKSTGQISRIIKRLLLKGLIKKVNKTYRYYLTSLGNRVIKIALKIKELFIVQEFNYC